MNPILLPVLDVLLKSAGVLLFACALQSFWRRAAATQRCLTWLAAFSVLLLLPLTIWMKPVWTVQMPEQKTAPLPMPKALPTIQDIPVIPTSAPAETPVIPEPAWHVPSLSVWQWMGLIWLTGTAGLLLRRIIGAWQLRSLHRQSHACEEPRIVAIASRFAAGLGVRRRVDLRFSSKVSVPLTWGFVKPVLMLPEDAVHWKDATLEAALCHELGHIRHWDALTRLIMTVLCALQWPNVLLWLAAKSWCTAQEQACDDLVLNSGACQEDYAMQLLESARSVQSRGLLYAALTMAQPSTLETRLSAIMDGTRDRRPLRRSAVLTGFAAMFAALAFCAALQLRAETNDPDQPLVWCKIVRIEIDPGAKLPPQWGSLGWSHPAVVLDSAKASELQTLLKKMPEAHFDSDGDQTGFFEGIGNFSHELQDSSGREVSLDAAGDKHTFVGWKRSLKIDDAGEGFHVKFKITESALLGDPGQQQPIERTGEADQTVPSGQTLLIHASNLVVNSKVKGLIYLCTVQKAVHNENLRLHGDQVEFSDATHQKGKVYGHTGVGVTTDGKPPKEYRGKADSIEFNLADKQVVLRGHPVVTHSTEPQGIPAQKIGTADDTTMIIAWNEPNGKLTTHGPSKTTLLTGPVSEPLPADKPTPAVNSPFKHIDIIGEQTNFDPLTGIATAKGHVEVKATSDGNPPIAYEGKADALEYDSNKKVVVLHGHAELTRNHQGHVGPLTDSRIVVDLNGPEGSFKIEKITEAGVQPKLTNDVAASPADPTASTSFTIVGQVARQGKYKLQSNENLTPKQAIQRAGGPTPYADLHTVQLVRKDRDGSTRAFKIDCMKDSTQSQFGFDLLVKPGDAIMVFERTDLFKSEPSYKEHQRPMLLAANGPIGTVTVASPPAKVQDAPKGINSAAASPSGASATNTSRSFAIYGEVTQPGEYELKSQEDITPRQALQRAGGASGDADVSRVELLRKEANDMTRNYRVDCRIDAKPAQSGFDLRMKPGDILIVKSKSDHSAPYNEYLDPQPFFRGMTVAADEATSAKGKITPKVDASKSSAMEKAGQIIVPVVQLNQATLDEALEFLRIKARELDPDKKGVNIVLNVGPQSPARNARLTMDLKQIPLGEALRYVAGLADLEITADEKALILQEPGKKDKTVTDTGTLDFTGGTVTINNGGTLVATAPSPPLTKANQIILPTVKFQGATLEEALDFLRIKAKELDPAKEGVNILLNVGPQSPARSAKLTLDLKQIPLGEALRYVAGLANLEIKADDKAIILQELGKKDTATTTILAPKPRVARRDQGIKDTTTATTLTPEVTEFDGFIDYGRPIQATATEGTLNLIGGATIVLNDTSEQGTLVFNNNGPPSHALTKAGQIILPTVAFREATLDEALDFLRVKAKELDPAKEGVNILLNAGPQSRAREAKLTMDLRNIPLAEALHYVAGLANLVLTCDDHAMILQEPAPRKPPTSLGVTTIRFTSPDSPTLAKANKIILPRVDFSVASDVDADVSFLRNEAKEFDPEKQGVKIILNMSPGRHLMKGALHLKDVPLAEALRYVADAAQFDISADDQEHAIILQERTK